MRILSPEQPGRLEYLCFASSLPAAMMSSAFEDTFNSTRAPLAEALEGMRVVGDAWSIGRQLSGMAHIELASGNHAAARQACAELVQIAGDGEALILLEAACSVAELVARGLTAWMRNPAALRHWRYCLRSRVCQAPMRRTSAPPACATNSCATWILTTRRAPRP